MNYYKILNLEKNCNEKDIKCAYKKLAIRHHPDKGGDSEKFKQISEAYEILSDKDKKFKYDHYYQLNTFSYTNPFELFEKVIKQSDLIYAQSQINNNYLFNVT